jgi:hypothetical protein
MSDDTDTEPTKQELLDRIEQLEDTVAAQQQSRSNLSLSRRSLLAAGGVGALGLGAIGNVTAQTSGQVGTIGTTNDRVDLFVQDLDVSGTATGISGGVLSSGDSITVHEIESESSAVSDESFIDLYNSSATDVIGGVVYARRPDWQYTFSSGKTVNGIGGDGYDFPSPGHLGTDERDDSTSVSLLPPATDVVRIEVGQELFSNHTMGAHVYTLD